MAQHGAEAQGCVSIERVDVDSRRGRHSLALEMDLDGSSEDRRGGEAFVILQRHPTTDAPVPIDLAHQRVTAWVKAPSTAQGDLGKPNGLRLFAKDQGWRSRYSSWVNVHPDRWIRLELDLRAPRAADGETVRSDFDASAVVAIGVRMDVVESHFSGRIHVDSVDW